MLRMKEASRLLQHSQTPPSSAASNYSLKKCVKVCFAFVCVHYVLGFLEYGISQILQPLPVERRPRRPTNANMEATVYIFISKGAVTFPGIGLSRGIPLSLILVCTSGPPRSGMFRWSWCRGSVRRALWNTRPQSPSLCSNLGYARRINIVLWMLMYNQPKSS